MNDKLADSALFKPKPLGKLKSDLIHLNGLSSIMSATIAELELHNRILQLISALRSGNSAVSEIVELVYTNGACAYLYDIIKAVAHEARPWGYAVWSKVECHADLIRLDEELDYDHIVTEVNGRFYDINGEFTLGVDLHIIKRGKFKGEEYICVRKEFSDKEMERFKNKNRINELMGSIAVLASSLQVLKKVEEND